MYYALCNFHRVWYTVSRSAK